MRRHAPLLVRSGAALSPSPPSAASIEPAIWVYTTFGKTVVRLRGHSGAKRVRGLLARLRRTRPDRELRSDPAVQSAW